MLKMKLAGVALLGALAFSVVPSTGSNAAPVAPQTVAATEAGVLLNVGRGYGYRGRFNRNRRRCTVKRTCVIRYGRRTCRVVRKCRR
ncbi:MAG: hypothetical protein SGJ17_08455 [Hyphomicrobiales bacterium]|nr:hypothetical protein [Hyphomicrobiales bacterium]